MAILALILATTLVNALTLNTPSSLTASTNNTVSWTAADGDPSSFSLELLQPQLLNGPLGIVPTVNTSDGSVTFILPEVPAGSDYTIEAVGVSNITNVLDTSDSFAISAAPSPTTVVLGQARAQVSPRPS
ncbi:hypothetical protein EXIGLDRAFT_482355 [Exidia glandulosa HHB12029]|uniref:Yeast cell wall synthesis Kre9/Knh1-like N-terminal domain-containing protein n=1 Tax=Exidia glandulosa HHB12029 TaxID=1314781 RepID=A0A165PHT2_EXIGL|nr:hypothetical protein EXIGLDRAFT_482355 [Exidia glandulosa HHB12029]